MKIYVVKVCRSNNALFPDPVGRMITDDTLYFESKDDAVLYADDKYIDELDIHHEMQKLNLRPCDISEGIEVAPMERFHKVYWIRTAEWNYFYRIDVSEQDLIEKEVGA